MGMDTVSKKSEGTKRYNLEFLSILRKSKKGLTIYQYSLGQQESLMDADTFGYFAREAGTGVRL